MRLCDKDIEDWLDTKKLIINPRPNKNLINGATVDIRLGHYFRTFSKKFNDCIDLSKSKKDINTILNKAMSEEIFISEKNCFF